MSITLKLSSDVRFLRQKDHMSGGQAGLARSWKPEVSSYMYRLTRYAHSHHRRRVDRAKGWGKDLMEVFARQVKTTSNAHLPISLLLHPLSFGVPSPTASLNDSDAATRGTTYSMRLIEASTLTFQECLTWPQRAYVSVSHCWSHDPENPEVSYQQFHSNHWDRASFGGRKILTACRIAQARGFDWVWIDTACIDKTSSAELSETINSMYKVYELSAECYVLLDDVPARDQCDTSDSCRRDPTHDIPYLARSRWFTRGWTLQELLAPAEVIFFNRFGEVIGTKSQLASMLSASLGIHYDYLTRRKALREASVAQRMSWASRRKTTRPEDMAYSLLGLFDVALPLLYGEGSRAFLRLQLAIISQSSDESIFAWGLTYGSMQPSGLLASCPRDFAGSERVLSAKSEMRHGVGCHGTIKGISCRHINTFGETLRTFFRSHYGETKVIEPACSVIEDLDTVRPIGIKVEFHRGQYYRTGLYLHSPSFIPKLLVTALSSETTLHVAATQEQCSDGEIPESYIVRGVALLGWCIRCVVAASALYQSTMMMSRPRENGYAAFSMLPAIYLLLLVINYQPRAFLLVAFIVFSGLVYLFPAWYMSLLTDHTTAYATAPTNASRAMNGTSGRQTPPGESGHYIWVPDSTAHPTKI